MKGSMLPRTKNHPHHHRISDLAEAGRVWRRIWQRLAASGGGGRLHVSLQRHTERTTPLPAHCPTYDAPHTRTTPWHLTTA
eukprot:1250881-Rhodomonas_salina.2